MGISRQRRRLVNRRSASAMAIRIRPARLQVGMLCYNIAQHLVEFAMQIAPDPLQEAPALQMRATSPAAEDERSTAVIIAELHQEIVQTHRRISALRAQLKEHFRGCPAQTGCDPS